MKRNMLLSLALIAIVPLQAQVGKESEYEKMKKATQSQYEQFKQQSIQDYESFRQKANAEYAQFMEETWKEYEVKAAEALPQSPKPVKVLEAEKAPVTNAQIFYDEDIESRATDLGNSPDADLPMAKTEDKEFSGQPEPLEPILPVFDANAVVQNLFLYGSNFPVRMEKEKEMSAKAKPLKLKNTSEKSVARMWRKLSCTYYDNMVAECLQQRRDRNLCDWAYVKLTETMAAKQFGEGTNEAVLLQMYLLTQSGYQMRIGRVDDHLTLLMGSKEKIYRYKYFILDGVNYYILDPSMANKSMYVFDHAFPKEKALSLAMTQPKLSVARTKQRTITSERYPELKVSIETNQNLIDFYNDYPQCAKWDYYSKASMSDVLKSTLLPGLRKAIEGKSEEEAADIILNLVQTGFTYKVDEDQFGYERPLYPDETFYYPYSDCEDRSILFSCLIRELLNLDVVLLNYPNHLATAVCFNEKVDGDYLTIDDKDYIICDPTCRNAPVGYCHRNYKDKKPKVVRF